MHWLLARQIRPFIKLAAVASLLLNLALLAPALYMLQVFDRVFASGSIETLVMLAIPVGALLALAYCMDAARSRALAAAGRRLESCLAPEALASQLDQRAAGRPDPERGDALRDVAQLRRLLAGPGVVALFDAPWVPLYLLTIAAMHPLLGGIALTGALALFGLGMFTEYATRRHAERAIDTGRATQRHAEALLRNSEVVVAMGMTGAAVAQWQGRCDEQHRTQESLAAASARLGALARVARQLLQVIALGFGAWLVIGRQASPGIMIAATILLGRALQPVELLIGGWKSMIEARGAWGRLAERKLRDRPQRLSLPAPMGRLEVERLSFAFAPQGVAQGAPLLRNLCFTVFPGESLGIVGPSAAGKTTLLRLLLGVRTAQSGTVRLDGSDIARWDREQLGRAIGYLPQNVELFAGSVAANIARLQEPDPEAVIRAAQLAQAHELILRLSEGYDTEIGEGGCLLSGGQRQRIALARALYGEPRLLVLDEPNANLDEEGDDALAAALATLKARGITVVVVSHRRRLISQLDRIAILRNGKLEAFGPSSLVLGKLGQAMNDGSKVVPFTAPTQVSA
ncbi:MAG TPA: type I secretion system permease/ATPase [Steroidobacteraceae bacterium]|nr:type I secretion system permease/ATPase [Steroidobacteraceae bacterium]